MKIIQISDTHLFKNDQVELFGVKTNLKFKEVIKNIIDTEQNVDLILLTGDLSQDCSKESYSKIVKDLDNLNIPIYWIPGNHDDFFTMKKTFKSANNFQYERQITFLNWQIIFADTTLDNSAEGYLSDLELNELNTAISKCIDKKIIIVMHHHPFEVGTPLIDQYILKNNIKFWDLISKEPVKLIISGHVHGDYQIIRNNIPLETAPATCFQWIKGTKELKIDCTIGYKIYYFDNNHYGCFTKLW